MYFTTRLNKNIKKLISVAGRKCNHKSFTNIKNDIKVKKC